jgi:tetratricopeptide (TPR) repeat protein
MNRICMLLLLTAIWIPFAGAADDQPLATLMKGMGNHQHTITTKSTDAQKFFNQGLTYSYAFNHAEAEKSFREAARLDPDCAMCQWGIAYVLGPNINAAMDPQAVSPAYAAMKKAGMFSAKVTDKERAYITALSKRYSPAPVDDRTSLNTAFADAMRKVTQQYPDDLDAAVIFAEAAMDVHPWDYWDQETGEAQPWTAEIISTLESVLKRDPNHPGANHFYIHAVEASNKAGRALPSADRLNTLVPAAGHLVHMPGHIYIRTGDYAKAAEANRRAIEADNSYLSGCHVPQGAYALAYVPHNYHFLWAALIMDGANKEGTQAAFDTAAKVDHKMMREEGFGTLQHYFSIPLYNMVRFGNWKEILERPAPDKDLLYPTAIWHYARGMAFARNRKLKEAKAELDSLKKLSSDPGLQKVTFWEINKAADILAVALDHLSGELSAASGKIDEAAQHLKHGIELEDHLNYDEPPPWSYPLRHSFGAILLDAKRFAEAEAIYREDLKRHPKNGWALIGLHNSLMAQGKKKEAAEVKQQFDQAWARADVKITSSRF